MAVQDNLLALLLTVVLLVDTSSSESCETSDMKVRLVNGTSARNGQVELCWSNQWKAVCDDGWGLEEAITVCRELGYLNSNGRAIAVSGSYFGDTQEIHQLQQWDCQSTEKSLTDCMKTIAHQHCSASETAGVYCQGDDGCEDGDIRLMNGSNLSSYEGRVEICYYGVWGTVCSDGWDSRDATVVCRELGILEQSLGIAIPFFDLYGEGEGPIMLERVDCDEDTTLRLSECRRSVSDPTPGVISEYCTHSKDAGVICRGSSDCIDGEIRLVGGLNESDGVVEICFGRTWGRIRACDDRWNDSNARVACGQLGYLQDNATEYTESADEANRIQHLSHVTCSGEESRLTDCSHEVVGVDTCPLRDSNMHAAVRCLESAMITNIRQESSSIAPSPTPVMSTIIIPSTSSDPPTRSAPLTSRSGVIIATTCGIVVAIIALAILVTVVSMYMYVAKSRKQQHQSHKHEQARDNNLRQNIEQDKEVPKRVASPHSDNTDDDDEVERNFDNPLYAKVCREDQNNCDTLCHSTTL